jgi:glycosyltransferase involved in cell wall biosynthesis
MEGAADFLDEFDRASRIEFLRSVTVLSVPMPKGEAFGTFMIEAMAAGVPVVQPAAGAFAEIVGETGGGWLCEPGSAAALADALERVLRNPEGARAAGERGRAAVLSRFTIDRMADGVVDVYSRAIGKR